MIGIWTYYKYERDYNKRIIFNLLIAYCLLPIAYYLLLITYYSLSMSESSLKTASLTSSASILVNFSIYL